MDYVMVLQFYSLSSVLKSYGQQLKAPAAMVRLRLYETLTLLPANSLESSYTHLLRMLIAEFTLTENPANTTNSLLRELCHSDDSIILGTWLQETDHKTIEDQVKNIFILWKNFFSKFLVQFRSFDSNPNSFHFCFDLEF